ncbi:MAG: DNA repair protein RecO [Chitinophagales bacterium]
MLLQTRGLVLRITKYSESSIIARVFTRERGVQSIILKGVRSSKAKNKAAIWHPGNLLDMIIYFQSGKNLKNIKECRLHHIYSRVQGNMLRSAMLMFLTEVLNAVLKEEDELENTVAYEFVEQQFLKLDEAELPDKNFHIRFLLRLSNHFGIYPKDNYSQAAPYFKFSEGAFSSVKGNDVLNADASKQLFRIMNGENFNITTAQRSQLIEALLNYYRVQIGDFGTIRSHLILHQVFA